MGRVYPWCSPWVMDDLLPAELSEMEDALPQLRAARTADG